ncbi:MAG: DUF4124 domain-containing protein [Rudaea sp.]
MRELLFIANSRAGDPAVQQGRINSILLLSTLTLAVAGAWWYFAPDTLPDAVRHHLPASAKSNPTLYRWKDAKGGVHVTDVPPADRPYETLHYDPKTNVVPTVVPPKGTIR